MPRTATLHFYVYSRYDRRSYYLLLCCEERRREFLLNVLGWDLRTFSMLPGFKHDSTCLAKGRAGGKRYSTKVFIWGREKKSRTKIESSRAYDAMVFITNKVQMFSKKDIIGVLKYCCRRFHAALKRSLSRSLSLPVSPSYKLAR